MRTRIQAQMPLVHQPIAHQHARELAVITDVLDDHPEVVDLVFADIVGEGGAADNGRPGMTAEQVLRALIVKQINGYSYADLAFHLPDSTTFGRFCRLGIGDKPPSESTLQRNIKRIRPETLEAINRVLVVRARDEGLEPGEKVRTDCTVTETNIHAPNDSGLLWDCVRALVRVMGRARDLIGVGFVDRSRRAKRRAHGIDHAKTDRQRVRLYKDLLKVTGETVDQAEYVAVALDRAGYTDPIDAAIAMVLAKQIRHYVDLAHRVVRQTERRVINGEKVPARDKVVSIFEPHTDIIKKERRETEFGHKLCLSAGASGLVLDCVVLDGNPADSTLAVDMTKRHVEILGRPPRQSAFDGGFASKANLRDIKALGVKDVMFHKRRGLKVTDMVRSTWIYRRLRDFRAGIEGIISFLKRGVGLKRCTWKGHQSFKAYCWASIVSANLLLLARHLLL